MRCKTESNTFENILKRGCSNIIGTRSFAAMLRTVNYIYSMCDELRLGRKNTKVILYLYTYALNLTFTNTQIEFPHRWHRV